MVNERPSQHESEAEQQLRSERARVRAIVETAVDGIIVIDARGNVESMNRAAEVIFGYEEAEVLGQNVSMLMPPPYRDEHDGYLKNYEETGKARIIGIGREVEGRRKDGSVFPMDLSVGEAMVNGEKLYTGIIRDVTERRSAEEALRDAESRMRAIVETVVDGVIAIDERGRIQSFNLAAEQIFGYTADEVIGRNVSMLMPSPYHEEHDTYLKNYQETGEARIIGIGREVTGLRKDGSKFPMDLAVGATEIGGRPLYTGVVRDITARRRSEEALRDAQKLESLAVLAGGVAHDFNNLLVGILGNTSLALEHLSPTSPLREYLEDVQVGAQRAAELSREILAYSGRGRFVIQQVDINALIREMGHLLRLSLSKDASVRYNFAPSLPPVEADATQMRQVIMNLVMNASDAIGERAGIITITTGLMYVDREYLDSTYLKPDIPEGAYVSIEVSDTGEGMSADVQARIFDPFFTTKFSGRGLGLAATLGIVRGHKGAIKVYSEPGRGTTFKLLIPPVDAELHSSTVPAVDESWLARGTVLVVDDEEASRMVAARTLRAIGFEVLLARDGHEAIDICSREPERIGLVLLDLTMPGMSGSETFTELRRLNSTLPVVLMSGYAEEEATAAFAGKGIKGFIQKPYLPATLREMVRSVLGDEDTTSA